jgi:hypothetical protein
MAHAVRFGHYGGPEVLHIAEVEVSPPPAGEVVVEVRAAGINPGEAAIRSGALAPLVCRPVRGVALAGWGSAAGCGVALVRSSLAPTAAMSGPPSFGPVRVSWLFTMRVQVEVAGGSEAL